MTVTDDATADDPTKVWHKNVCILCSNNCGVEMRLDGREITVADWETKRAWHDEAFARFESAGYRISSAYTVVKKDGGAGFLYRDNLWHGNDLVGLGVSSFSHLAGVHFQNLHKFDPYVERVESGSIPVHRSMKLTDDEKLIREFVLQLKLGRIETAYFRDKFGVDVRERFGEALAGHQAAGDLEVVGERVVLSRAGLLEVDRLLHDFFQDEHRGARYA